MIWLFLITGLPCWNPIWFSMYDVLSFVSVLRSLFAGQARLPTAGRRNPRNISLPFFAAQPAFQMEQAKHFPVSLVRHVSCLAYPPYHREAAGIALFVLPLPQHTCLSFLPVDTRKTRQVTLHRESTKRWQTKDHHGHTAIYGDKSSPVHYITLYYIAIH